MKAMNDNFLKDFVAVRIGNFIILNPKADDKVFIERDDIDQYLTQSDLMALIRDQQWHELK